MRADVAPTTTSAHQAAVLTAFNSPEITVETVGPKRISIGREATYRVIVRNRGQSQAEQVVVTVGIPQWAEIAQLTGPPVTPRVPTNMPRANRLNGSSTCSPLVPRKN